MRFQAQIDDYFSLLKQTLDRLDRREVNQLIELFVDAYNSDATIFICGNGGSANTASHMACDLNKGVGYGRTKRVRVHALTDNLATIMAYANDVGYDDIFVEQLQNFLKPGDLVVAISGSGNSKNVLKAVDLANARGNTTVGLTGYDGGALRRAAKYSVNAGVSDMQISEDVHLVLNHVLMQALMHATREEPANGERTSG